MTAEIELLPMPEGEASSFGNYKVHDNEAMVAYARANVARNTALLRAEIEALRAEVERLRADRGSREQQPAATSETVNVIGMPEFDGLLDHIYEHGTAAEGVIEKANAFARAVIARYAPQQPAGVWHSWHDLPERAALATRLADDAAESVICTEGQIQRPGVWRITREVLDADRAYLSDCLQHLAWRQMADVAEDHNTGDVIVTFRGEHPADSEATPALPTEQWRSD